MMKKITNWTYEAGMERIEFCKELGHEIKLVEAPRAFHVYRDGNFYATMDKKGCEGGYILQQTIQGKRFKSTLKSI